ncbi:hypothetical protein QVD17_15818 [Tagetes erecta]|uniref:Uncharacterized protein n=1 Tax=Tagetes erecta TaxID=13708 RepID=A0AAD8KWN7_TARER|nr:hypothetical protein QVD17_15818 [Tagetes erecta]
MEVSFPRPDLQPRHPDLQQGHRDPLAGVSKTVQLKWRENDLDEADQLSKDEVISDQVEPAVKRKIAGAGAGVLQNKGKWKSGGNRFLMQRWTHGFG